LSVDLFERLSTAFFTKLEEKLTWDSGVVPAGLMVPGDD
jgi:hypothetical protein